MEGYRSSHECIISDSGELRYIEELWSSKQTLPGDSQGVEQPLLSPALQLVGDKTCGFSLQFQADALNLPSSLMPRHVQNLGVDFNASSSYTEGAELYHNGDPVDASLMEWIRSPSPGRPNTFPNENLVFSEIHSPFLGAKSPSSSGTIPSSSYHVEAELAGRLLSDDEGNNVPSLHEDALVWTLPKDASEMGVLQVKPLGEQANGVSLADCHNSETLEKATSGATYTELIARVKDEILGRLSMRDEFLTATFQSKLSPTKTTYCPSILPGTEGESQDYLVADNQGAFCINVGKAPGPEGLVIWNSLTQEFRVLPPLNHPRHPVLMHLRVDDSGDFKVVVAGSGLRYMSEGLSLRTEVFTSTSNEWECTGDIPGPLFALNEYQTGVHYKDNSENEFLFCVATLDEKGTKGVLVYDFQEKQWQDSIERPIPFAVRGKLRHNYLPSLGTVHLVGCGRSIFVVSEQEYGGDKYFCIHKLNPEKVEGDFWKQIMRHKRTGTASSDLQGRMQVYPDFIGVPSSATGIATMLKCGESVIVFSEQEFDKNSVFIYIHMLTLDGSGGGQWQVKARCKIPRYRGPLWKPEERIASLKCRIEVLGKVEGNEHWVHNSKCLKESYGIIRSSKQCENLSGTVLKSFLKIQKHLQLNNIQPGTSDWDNFWQTSGNEALLGVVNQECYQLMETIERSKRPRKKIGRVHKQEVYAGVRAPWPSVFDDLANSSGIHSANPSPAARPLTPADSLRQYFDLIKIRRDIKNEEYLEMKRMEIEEMKERNKEIELRNRGKELQLEVLKLQERKKACASAGLRPHKRVKKST